jgi:hypothetical protein
MKERRQPSSDGPSAGASWRTVLPLACIACGFYCEVTLPGRVYRVKGKTWLLAQTGALVPLRGLACPACGRAPLWHAERLS